MYKKTDTGCPLVHCITNYVAMEFTANAILAVGARPLMSFFSDEMDDIVRKSSALLVNIGCLDYHQCDGMISAVAAAKSHHVPWVLDPVGIQLSQPRADICRKLINLNPPAIIKSNKEESPIISSLLSGESYADDIVLVQTGEVDVISQGNQYAEVTGGDSIMKKVTAVGCVAGGVLAAYLAKGGIPFQSAVDAMTIMSRAGEKAAVMSNGGTGTFKTLFLDELCRLS